MGEIKGLTRWAKTKLLFCVLFPYTIPPPYVPEKKHLSMWTTSAELDPLYDRYRSYSDDHCILSNSQENWGNLEKAEKYISMTLSQPVIGAMLRMKLAKVFLHYTWEKCAIYYVNIYT